MTDQSRSGGSVSSNITGAHTGEVHIEAAPSEDRQFTAHEFARRWREKVGEMPEAENLQFTADIFQAGDAINIVLNGANFDELQDAAEWLKGELAKLKGVIDIADDGPGIPREHWDSLFLAFRSKQRGGTGLGLAIARDLAVAQGGALKLTRSTEDGSEFRLQLPMEMFTSGR